MVQRQGLMFKFKESLVLPLQENLIVEFYSRKILFISISDMSKGVVIADSSPIFSRCFGSVTVNLNGSFINDHRDNMRSGKTSL